MANPIRTFAAGHLSATVYESAAALAEAAAAKAADSIREAIGRQGHARIVVATGNSQIATMERLVQLPGIDWSRVDAFHLDEYVGLPDSHPASFRLWIRTRFAAPAKPRTMEYLTGDAPDLQQEIARYTALLQQGPLDLAFIGIGENGHIAFNDPGVADFEDPAAVKAAVLDEACRRQQVGEGHFPNIAAVPTQALTLTCSTILSIRTLVCAVPDRRKAAAVRHALEGPITTACPASALRTRPGVFLFLDPDSASELSL